MTTPGRARIRNLRVPPRRAGKIWHGAVRYARTNPLLVLGASATSAILGQGTTLLLQDRTPVPMSAMGSGLVATVLAGAVNGLLLCVLGRAVGRKHVGLGELWAVVSPRLRGLVGLALLIGLAVGLLVALAVALLLVWASGVVDDRVGNTLLIIAAAAALIAIGLGVRWSLAAPAYVFEDVSVVEAFARSRQLVRGASWRVFGYLLLICLASVALAVLVEFSLGRGTLTGPVVPWQPATIADRLPHAIALTIAQTCALPLMAGVTGLLYIDRRGRSEQPVEPDADAPTPVTVSGQWNGAVLAMLVVIVVLGAVATVVAAVPTRQPQRTNPTGVHDFTKVITAELDGRAVAVSGGMEPRPGQITTIRVWELPSGAPIGEPISVTGMNVMTTARLNGRPVVLAGSHDGKVRAWDLATRSPVGAALQHDGSIEALITATLDGRTVVIADCLDNTAEGDTSGHEGTIRVWDLATGSSVGRPIATTDDRFGGVDVVDVDGRQVIVVGSDRRLRTWDLATGDPLDSAFDTQDYLTIWELDGRNVVVSVGRGGIWLRDLNTRERLGEPIETDYRFSALSVAWLEDRIVILTGSQGSKLNKADGAIQMWDLETGDRIGPPLAHATTLPNGNGASHPDVPSVQSVTAADVDGRPVIIAADDEGTVRIWDPFRWGWRYGG